MSERVTRTHTVERIVTIPPNDGEQVHLCSSADNRACAVLIQRTFGAEPSAQIVFGDRTVAEFGAHHLPRFALSFDGARLATAQQRADGVQGSRILVNGEVAYDTPIDTIHRLVWIGADRLAWDGWNEDEKHGIRYFVDGVETTGAVEFESVWGQRGRTEILLWERGVHCVVHDDGTRVDERPMPYTVWRRQEWEEPPQRPEMPTETRRVKDGRGPLIITYRGRAHPPIGDIETGGGMRSFAFNEDRSKVAYVAIQRSGAVDGIITLVMAPIIAADAAEAWARAPGIREERFGYAPPARRAIANVVQAACWAPSWIAALLCNPYTGILHALAEGNRRWYPVNDGRRWRKGYAHASDHFFTPQDELVVTVQDGTGQRVVIDEDEGPSFDTVSNVRFLPNENCVSYCARRGSDVLRVTVRE